MRVSFKYPLFRFADEGCVAVLWTSAVTSREFVPYLSVQDLNRMHWIPSTIYQPRAENIPGCRRMVLQEFINMLHLWSNEITHCLKAFFFLAHIRKLRQCWNYKEQIYYTGMFCFVSFRIRIMKRRHGRKKKLIMHPQVSNLVTWFQMSHCQGVVCRTRAA